MTRSEQAQRFQINEQPQVQKQMQVRKTSSAGPVARPVAWTIAGPLALACLGISLPCSAQSSDAPEPPRLYGVVEGQTDGLGWVEEYWSYTRLAAVRCVGEQGNSLLRNGHCRYKDYTGTLLTYHPDGSVSEVLHLSGGLLDGLAEAYDDKGHLMKRSYFRQGVELAAEGLALGQSLGPAENLPEPPIAPLPTNPPPAPAAAPTEIRGSGGPGRYLPRPPFQRHFELGINNPFVYGRGSSGSFVEGSIFSQLYLGVQLWRFLTTTVDVGLLPNIASGNRSVDWPILRAGLRVPLSRGPLIPYLLGGATVSWADSADLGSNPDVPVTESAWYLGVDCGIGLAWLLGGSVRLSIDGRYGRNFRVDGGAHFLLPDDSGALQEVMGSYHFASLNFGFAVQL